MNCSCVFRASEGIIKGPVADLVKDKGFFPVTAVINSHGALRYIDFGDMRCIEGRVCSAQRLFLGIDSRCCHSYLPSEPGTLSMKRLFFLFHLWEL